MQPDAAPIGGTGVQTNDRGPTGTVSSGTANGPSEVAIALGRLVEAISLDCARDLERLLAYEIGLPKSSELRQARLGVLVELVADGSGEIPGTAAYKRSLAAIRREGEASHGDAGASVASLINAYGSWHSAVRAAMRLAAEGEGSRVGSSQRESRRHHASYDRDEALGALRKFRADFGRWPRHGEWVDWTTHCRRIARDGGNADPRQPSAKTLKRLFGSFADAVQAAKAAC